MKLSVKTLVKTSLSAAALTLVSGSAMAGLVTPKATSNWVAGDNVLNPGTTIQYLAANSSKAGYTGNPALENDGWGHQGAWLNFQVLSTTDTIVTLTSAAINSPAFTIYRTDGAFDGGNGSTDASGTTDVLGQPHNFNQVAQAGTAGIIWATDNSVSPSLAGNTTVNGIVETLGYANSSGIGYTNGYGASVAAGAFDLSTDNLYETGVTGSVGTGLAKLTLRNLAAGWYTIFLGGANNAGSVSAIDVSVAAVPLPSAVWLFGSAVLGLVGASRKKIGA